MATIAHEDNGINGRFFIKENDEDLAQMVYIWSGKDKIIIEHTEVNEKLKGQNIGAKLLGELVSWVRSQNIKIIPVCPFAKAMMEKKAEDYKDVMYHH